MKDNYFAELFSNPSINVQVMTQTNPDGRTHVRTPKCRCDDFILLTASRLDKIAIVLLEDKILDQAI